jgi:hypothetical protein
VPFWQPFFPEGIILITSLEKAIQKLNFWRLQMIISDLSYEKSASTVVGGAFATAFGFAFFGANFAGFGATTGSSLSDNSKTTFSFGSASAAVSLTAASSASNFSAGTFASSFNASSASAIGSLGGVVQGNSNGTANGQV